MNRFYSALARGHLPRALLLLALAGTTATQSPAAPIATKGGVVIFASSASGDNEFAEAREFVAMESIGMTSTFTFADGTKRQAQRPTLRTVVPYPDYATLTLVTDADWQAFQKFGTDAEAVARQYPRSVALMQALGTRIRAALQKRQEGNVVVAGQWMSLADYQKKAADAQADYVARLEVGGRVYKNARLSAVKDDQMKLMHDGGFSHVPVADLKKLPDDERKALARTNPRLAPVLGFKPGEVGASAGSIAASRDPGGADLATFSFTIRGGEVVINRVGASETYPVDKVPAAYLAANVDLARAVKEHLDSKKKSQAQP